MFISQRDAQDFSDSLTPITMDELRANTSSFGDTFQAQLGVTVDEDLSISTFFNRELEQERMRQVNQLVDDGFSVNRYTNPRTGQIDYNQIAVDNPEFNLQTDDVIREQRNAKLARRREYAEEVIEKGSGFAQFTGAMTGFMLDPINIATMGFGASVAASRSLGAMANAMRVAKAEAGIAVATELAIQPLVYAHKMEIESPYSAEEALATIGFAAVAGGTFGGVIGGLSGYIRSVTKAADDLDAVKGDAEVANEVLTRYADDLDSAKAAGIIEEVDPEQVRTALVNELREELVPIAGNRLTKGERKALQQEINDLEFKLENVDELPEPTLPRKKNESNRAYKARLANEGRKNAQADRAMVELKLGRALERLEADNEAREAFGDLTRLEQGITPARFEERLNKRVFEEQVNREIQFMRERETRINTYNQPSGKAENYVEPEPQQATPQTSSSRQRETLEREGLDKDFDNNVEAYNNLKAGRESADETTKELIDTTDELLKDVDEDINDLEQVLRCRLG